MHFFIRIRVTSSVVSLYRNFRYLYVSDDGPRGSFVFSKLFILVRVAVDLEPMPGRLDLRQDPPEVDSPPTHA